jgi:hypothetical protein
MREEPAPMKNRFVLFALCLAPVLAPGQTRVDRLLDGRRASAGFSFQSWSAGDDRVTEWAFPVSFTLPVGSRAGLYALTFPAVSADLRSGGSRRLSGGSDLKLGGHALLLSDRVLFTAGVNVPSGKHALRTGEYAVASVLAQPAFAFRVPILGQGPDFQAGLSGAFEWRGLLVGCGTAYLKKGRFRPFLDADGTYAPGDEWSLTAGAEKPASVLGRDVRFTADALFSTYRDDRWGGVRVFRSGSRLLLQVRSLFRIEPFDVTLSARDRIRSKNRVGAGPSLDPERRNMNGNQFEIAGSAGRVVRPGLSWRGLASFRNFSTNGYGTGGASLFGLGAGIRLDVAPGRTLDLEGRYDAGSLRDGGGSVAASGCSLSGGFEIAL